MTKLSDPKTHLLMRLAGVRPIAMPHRIAVAGPGNKRTVDSLTRTGHLDADGKITAAGLSYVQSILTPIRDAEMRAAADATPFELNTDPTGLRPEATDAERTAHYARNIVADQEQRDADRDVQRTHDWNVSVATRNLTTAEAIDIDHEHATYLDELRDAERSNDQGEQVEKWMRRHEAAAGETMTIHQMRAADEVAAHTLDPMAHVAKGAGH